MMPKITTQAQLDDALKADPNATLEIDAKVELSLHISIGAPRLILLGKTILRLLARESSQPHVEAWGSSQPHVVARESSQPHVEAWGSSQPHVEAWESSQPHVVARGSSQPHVEAWESSQPHVVAKAYAQLSLFGKRIKASATENVAVLLHAGATVTGGRSIVVRRSTPEEWCDYYGIDIIDGVATLFKALNDDFTSPRGFSYLPGTIPVAPDWDGGKAECGGGLHFSPSPGAALTFHPRAKRFVGCPVRVADLAVHDGGQYPEKVKACGCCGPVFEVDRYGRPVVEEATR